MSTSVASLEFEPINEGTPFTHVEYGVFFDQFWADGPIREEGSLGLLRLWAATSRDPPPAIGRWLTGQFGRFRGPDGWSPRRELPRS